MSDYSDDIFSIVKKISSYPRFAGSPGSSHARELIISYLQKAGYKHELYSTTVPRWSIKSSPVIRFTQPENMTVNGIPAIFSPPTPSEGIKGKIVKDGTLMMLESFEWEKYAIVEDGKKKGYLISTAYGAQMQPLPNDAEKLPYAILDTATLERLKGWLSKGLEIEVKLKNPTTLDGTSEVVSIVTAEPEKKPYILVCAHYDTVFGTVGAHDNASGFAVALKLAQVMASQNRPICFAFFDGEETNKAGSYGFASDMKTKNTLKDISFVLEIDAVGTDDEIALLCSSDLNKKLQKLKEQVIKKSLKEYKVSISRQQKIGFSDVWPFMQEGVPVIRMLSRGNASKDITHTDKDTIDKINPKTLSSAFEVATAILQLKIV